MRVHRTETTTSTDLSKLKEMEGEENSHTLTRKATVVLDKGVEYKPVAVSDSVVCKKASSMTVIAPKTETSPNNLQNVPKVNPSLTHELNCLMQQFSIMAKNKTMIFNIVNQLQSSYKKMMKKNQDQEKEIRFLREQNRNLDEVKSDAGQGSLEISRLKSTLEACEVKLSTLEINMKKILMNNPAASQMALIEMENQKLIRTNSLLKFHLKQALLGLEKFRNVAFNVEQMYNCLQEKCKRYARMLKNKNEDTNELITSTIKQMKASTFQQLSELENIKQKYEKVLTQQKSLEQKWKIFEDSDIKKLQETVVQNGRSLENEMQKVSTILNHNNLSKGILISEYETTSEETASKEEAILHQVSISTLQSNQTNSSKNMDSTQTEGIQANTEGSKFCTTIDEDYELECEFETCE